MRSRRLRFPSGVAVWISRFALLCCLLMLAIFFAPASKANLTLKVNEAAIRIFLERDPAQVSLPIENLSFTAVQTHIHLELLDPLNRVLAQTDKVENINGNQIFSLALPFQLSKLRTQERRQLPFVRLRYVLTDEQSGGRLAEGTLSISEIAPELFDLRIVTSDMAREGGVYSVRVQTINPSSLRPVSGVRIFGEVLLENDERDVRLQAYGSTDAAGYSILSFQVPKRFPQFPHTLQPAGGEIHVTAQRGALIAEATEDVLVDQLANVLITTDKPMYQPGQTLYARALVLSPSRKVLANQPVTFKLCDHNEQVILQSSLTTSRFGIASVDWPIADNIKLGPYRIRVSLSDDDDDEWSTSAGLMITRYDLPNFSVSVQPDRRYYLPEQNAKLTVNANYLFGQPVTRAHVRVVRETDRSWNYEEQKRDTEVGETFEGDTDANGVFVTAIDLEQFHNELEDSSAYNRFDDLKYAAYVTDLSTNRTEQRRFDLRVTRQPIHVYLVHDEYYFDRKGKLPLQFYVSTYYADGTPAQCNVSVKVAQKDGAPGPQLQVRTNRYGLAKVSGLLLPRAWKEGDINFSLAARDSRGEKGTNTTDNLEIDDDVHLNIETNKSLYRAGEPITAVVNANFDDGWIFVDLATKHRVLHSQRLKLHGGRTQITFPYSSEFKDQLTIAAYPDYPKSQSAIATHSVLYPENDELKVEAVAKQQTYRPGESAQIDLFAKPAGGSLLESALGVIVVDRAVDERARTDEDFGRDFRTNQTWQTFMGEDEELSGITMKTLRQLNMSKPVPADLELVAAALLNRRAVYFPRFMNGDTYESDLYGLFNRTVTQTLLPLKTAVASHYAATLEHPSNESLFKRILSDSNVAFDELKDPWGVPFRPAFSVNRESDRLELITAGPDKQLGTADDFTAESLSWPYFRPIGEGINTVVRDYHQRTGLFIRDQKTLSDELARHGIDLETLRDRWGTPYNFTFGVAMNQFTINVRSAGPDHRLEKDAGVYGDDFSLWSNSIDYFSEARAQITSALNRWGTERQAFPLDENQLGTALTESGIDLTKLSDPWGRLYRPQFRLQTLYTDRVNIVSNQNVVLSQREKVEVTPVTRYVRIIALRSSGIDGQPNTLDDFDVATFSGNISEESASTVTAQLLSPIVIADGGGAIAGFVTDSTGAAVANSKVSATLSSQTFETLTKDDGSYSIPNLGPGTYQVEVEAAGFKKAVVSNVSVVGSSITNINVVLEVGVVTETVSVTSSAPNVSTRQITELPLNGRGNFSYLSRRVNVITKSGTNTETFTPRLREYFPETLLWQPELTTDSHGRTRLEFKLADNITTWKVSVIGSNENGEVGTAETEIRAFQPFFAELDPQRVLTEGDRISLPVVLRNYLDHKQAVDLELKPESWFILLEGNKKHTEVPAGDSTRQTFDIRATKSIKTGKQRVTAIGSDSTDAIEKEVTVHPDGEEKTDVTSDVLDASTTFRVNVPQTAIPGSMRSELRIYPNLMAHVWESIEGIMQRPYGCAEQTISSAYPSLLVLGNVKNGENSPLAAKARRYLEAGHQKLLGYQAEDGGFTYWGRGNSDVALTAYALRFLHDAAAVTPVEQRVIADARAWLLKQQLSDGRWPVLDWDRKEDPKRTAMLTALVARSLAPTLTPSQDPKAQSGIDRALTYLLERSKQIPEPYLLASYSLAASKAGKHSEAKDANAALRKLAHTESGATYWALETNTPFYGWGTAGRAETTAIALAALLSEPQADNRTLENSALLFLLRNKDEYGVWYSTQATVNVVEAMMTFLTERRDRTSSKAPNVELLINGSAFKNLSLPSDNQMVAPQTIDLTSAIRLGINQVEIKLTGATNIASMEVISNYYIPWSDSANSETARIRSGDSSSLRLQTRFDKQNVSVMEEVTCHVRAERIGFRGYGMLLAEIGLPPGADVDRASLETAMRGSEWSISQYDVLPDRVVVYLWPRAGGSEFSFKFRPRFGMTAKATVSSIYDYYNPEAKAVVAPGTFVVR